MAAFGKVLDLLDDRYLELQDVIGNVEPLPTLVPYEEYTQNVLAYRMDTNHEIFMGLIQDFTMRRAHKLGQELWTWFVQWEVDNSPPTQQPSSPKKVRLGAQQAALLSNTPPTPRRAPALTIFERRTLDGALMLEEEMLRILIDIVQVASALVPNFIEFLYRWVDYYEGDGKALKAALRWEIPSLWDFEYHPLVLPPEVGKNSDTEQEDDTQADGQRERRARSVSNSKAAELRQSSPTKKMHARPKPDLAAIELRTFYTEESERLQYREVKFGIQPPKLEQPLPPLINIPRDQRKRTKYYAACFKSRQRALYLLLEAGVTMRQINNYQKLQTAHPKETPETGDGNGLRNYQKDAKYAQAQFEFKEKQIKQREVAISNKLAVEAQLAASHAIPDGAAGLPLIPPTPSYARKPDMAAAMMQRINETRAKKDERIKVVPKPLVGRMRSKLFENAGEERPLKPIRDFMAEAGWYTSRPITVEEDGDSMAEVDEFLESSDEEESEEDEDGEQEEEEQGEDTDMEDGKGEGGDSAATAPPVSAPDLPRPSLPLPLLLQPSAATASTATNLGNADIVAAQPAPNTHATPALGSLDQFTSPNIETYMQNLNTEQAQSLLSLLSPAARQAVTNRLQESSPAPSSFLQQRISNIAEAVRSSVGDQSEESAEDRYMRSRLLEVPFPRPPLMPLLIGTQDAERTSAFQLAHGPQTTHQLTFTPSTPSTPLSPYTPPSGTMLPPPHPGITRNAPSPLFLSPPKPSPFTTLAPQILATSPFLNLSANPGSPIQIYLPKILVPGNGLGPGGTKMGNSSCIETDALLLGHEDARSGNLVLTKGILLPVGVWENTLRKVRSGRWSVLETYACPRSHPAKSKGKERKGEDEGKGCHGAVYEKLEQAYGMITREPGRREDELTKRWRVSRGPMTAWDRGAVWEGWAAYVDRRVEMSAAEREGAVKSETEAVVRVDDGGVGDSFRPYSDAGDAARRRREMEELIDEDEDMEG